MKPEVEVIETGHLSEPNDLKYLEWNIPKFSYYSCCRPQNFLISPSFTFNDISWHISLRPYDDLSVFLINECECPLNVNYLFGIKGSDGSLLVHLSNNATFKNKSGFTNFYDASSLQYNDILTIVCILTPGVNSNKVFNCRGTDSNETLNETVGELSEPSKLRLIQWEIPKFSYFSNYTYPRYSITSPTFTFENTKWHISFSPCDMDPSLFLINETKLPLDVSFSFSIKSSNGMLFAYRAINTTVKCKSGFTNFYDVGILNANCFCFLPSDTLTILLCILNLEENGKETFSYTVPKAANHSKFKVDNITKSKADNNMKCKADNYMKSKENNYMKSKENNYMKSKADNYMKSKADNYMESKADNYTKCKADNYMKSKADNCMKSKANNYTKSKADDYSKSKANNANLKSEVESLKLMKLTEIDVLCRDLKDLLTNKDFCDTILRVKGKEFYVHKAILVARSSVFADMFQESILEKRMCSVNILDCDSDTFQQFLEYLYTGRLDGISFNSAFQLYSTSDKFKVQELKMFCTKCIVENLNIQNICDVVVLADRYDDMTLCKNAEEFFCKNFKSIVKTNEWRGFYKMQPRLAGDLLIALSEFKE